MADIVPVDQSQRQCIENELASTFFVEAGAGTGKTTVMVERICNLVARGAGEISRIGAITFTEAAAAELKDRVRSRLEERAADPEAGQEEKNRCQAALENFDEACISTLHSFAGSLLREKPFEAGLPPNFDVSAEMEAGIRFEEKWQEWLDGVMDSEQVAPVLLKAMQMGLKTDGLKNAAGVLHANYDRLPERFAAFEAEGDDYITSLAETLKRLRWLQALAIPGCNDKLASHLQNVLELLGRIVLEKTGREAALRAVKDFGKLAPNAGQKKNWNEDPETGLPGCEAVKAVLREFAERTTAEELALRSACLVPLLEDLAGAIRRWAIERLAHGTLEFHDLLVLARDLLRDNPEVRRYFQGKFSHILIDEFQDTDPIQAEIAFFLAADFGVMGEKAFTEADWRRLSIEPGKLFVVGDPKQSIYRFRRADIAAVQKVSGMLGGEPVRLEQNFRSQEPVIGWVNSVFEEWMGEGNPGIQAGYVNLSSSWNDAAGEPRMGVYRFGSQVEGRAYQVKLAEGSGIAGIISNIDKGGWQIRQKESGQLRPVKYSDICILMPRRTNLPYIERALDGAEIPYRVESESFVLGSQDVRDLLNCLKAIDSPADRVALVAALRSSAFGISDVELVEFVDSGGELDYTSPGSGGGRVGRALEVLAEYNQRRIFEPVDLLIESFIRQRRMAELAFGRTRPRERLRRLKLVTEQARAFSSIGERSLRVFIDWMSRQMEEQARMVEIPVPETDEDAVRIMTMHAAKGLEFPVVILAGLGSGKEFAHPVIFGADGGCQVKLGSKDRVFYTACYEAAEEREKEAERAEQIRLMYVASTRARDYLLVSLYRGKNSHAINEIIEEIAERTGCGWRTLDSSRLEAAPAQKLRSQQADAIDSPAERLAWIERHKRLIQTASITPAVAVTTLTRQPEEEAEAGEVYFRKGRGGTSLGRAVHSVLQTIDLATGKDIEQISRSQADAEGIPEREAEVVRLVKKALAMPTVRRAVASGRFYRELFISLGHGNRQIEGFIDLLFEEENGLVIADYKTDVVLDFTDSVKLEQYRLQAGLYALAVSELTGKPVREVSLLFLSAGREINLGDIEALTAEARRKIDAVIEAGGSR